MGVAFSVAVCMDNVAHGGNSSSPSTENAPIVDTIEMLKRSNTGQKLILQGEKVWGSARLEDVVRWGESSRTDAILTRFLNPRTGEERRERRVTIYLKRGLGFEDRILDLAHELVHATSRPAWDPYDPSLQASGYISAAIEGSGGEVDAVIAECRVGLELGLSQRPSMARCRGYFENAAPGGEVRRERVTADFYRSGQWANSLRKTLNERSEELPHLSGESPVLFSSTGKLPYPMALFKEFDALNEVACRNSLSRLQSSSAPIRTRASEFVQSRCQKR